MRSLRAKAVAPLSSALEYDFLVAPGADPRRIQLRFRGVRQPEISDRGELILRTAKGELRQPKPFTYQEAGGRDGLRFVAQLPHGEPAAGGTAGRATPS